MTSKKSRHKISGPFYPWLIEMGTSETMKRLKKNSEAINVFSMFVTKYSLANEGKSLCVTYKEAKPFMSNSPFAKAKLWCMAFGFLHCRQFGRLERKPSLYDLSTKWRQLRCQPAKLDRIEHLLKRHEAISRILIQNIKGRGSFTPKVRKHMFLIRIEKEILGQ
jgi:hypothetical protein